LNTSFKYSLHCLFFITYHTFYYTTEEVGISNQEVAWLKEVEKAIKAEISNEDFNVEMLAQKMLLSKRQLERKIQKITGCSPAKLIKELRLQEARQILEAGNYASLAEVSYAVGIKTPSYFSRLFKKRFGKSPSKY